MVFEVKIIIEKIDVTPIVFCPIVFEYLLTNLNSVNAELILLSSSFLSFVRGTQFCFVNKTDHQSPLY